MSRRPLSFSRLPIKWKLTLWSSLLLVLLFAAYNAVQYVFIEKWMIQREKLGTRENMREILNYLLENELTFDERGLTRVRAYLEKANHPEQAIRVLDATGRPIVEVSDHMPPGWREAVPAYVPQGSGATYFQDRLLVMRSPLTIFAFTGTVEIVKSTESFVELIGAISRIMLACGVGAVVLSGLGGRLLAGQLLKPLQAMAGAIRNIKRQGLHVRVQVNDSQDEIATLMKMFNNMMDQVERSFQQQRQFVEDASHELRTPIAIIEGHLALLKRWGKNDPAILEESLNVSIQELARLKALVEELLALTRAEENVPAEGNQAANPDRVVRQVVKQMAVLYDSFRFDVELKPLAGISLAIAEPHLEQILLILLDNAVKYSAEDKIVLLRGSVEGGGAEGETARIEIADRGIGIPAADLPYVADRFYRVDKARSREQGGHGLGLSIAKRLVERYNGTLVIDSMEHVGTTVSISFPVLPRSSDV